MAKPNNPRAHIDWKPKRLFYRVTKISCLTRGTCHRNTVLTMKSKTSRSNFNCWCWTNTLAAFRGRWRRWRLPWHDPSRLEDLYWCWSLIRKLGRKSGGKTYWTDFMASDLETSQKRLQSIRCLNQPCGNLGVDNSLHNWKNENEKTKKWQSYYRSNRSSHTCVVLPTKQKCRADYTVKYYWNRDLVKISPSQSICLIQQPPFFY